MAEKIDIENGRISNFQGLVTLTLDQVILSYCILSYITHRPLPTFQISLKSKELFLDRRTYVRTVVLTYGQLKPILLRRLIKVDLKTAPNKQLRQKLKIL